MSAEYKNKVCRRNDASSQVTPGAFRETGQGNAWFSSRPWPTM